MSEISTDTFYGGNLREYHEKYHAKVAEYMALTENEPQKIMPQRILGPTQFWASFPKQQEALNVAAKAGGKDTMSALCTFVLQKQDGYRRFVVAHPEVYWWYDQNRQPECRCSYEVIPADSPCQLYFDLEFNIDSNPDRNGPRMTETLTNIFCAYIMENWGFPCNISNVLSLDSTTDTKFSRHLIFRVKNTAFKDNSHVGRFVKKVCRDIRSYSLVDNDKQSVKNDILSKFNKDDIKELFVNNGDVGRKLFVDEGVYTRNRHFRIYKSTKWGKKSYLIESVDSKYVPVTKYKDKEKGIFLDSLIAYIPNKTDVILFEFDDYNEVNASRGYSQKLTQSRTVHSQNICKNSQFPDVDTFILNIVSPGSIRELRYFESSRTLVYEIVGNRYCANIGRAHKSNNIYWIVDLNKQHAYQKCHDSECDGFKSQPIRFTEKLCFLLDEDNDMLLASIADHQENSFPWNNPVNTLTADGSDLDPARMKQSSVS